MGDYHLATRREAIHIAKLTKDVVQSRFEEAISPFNEAQNACDLAIVLGNEGAKGQCGNSRQCVLAQYFANKTGAICAVGGASDIEFYATEKDWKRGNILFGVGDTSDEGDYYNPFDAKLQAAIDNLISKFDGHAYRFLEGNMKGWHGQERKRMTKK